jgi:hypothetical protein
MAFSDADIASLVAEPREALDIEVKEWLDLTGNEHRSLLAKEIIALANHGGGYIVIGFRELQDGTFEPANPRPINLDQWSQDAIQSIVAKYLDPAVQCSVRHQLSSRSGEIHPVIIVPGGHRVPVRAQASSPDGKKLVSNRVYIRRAGPNSEEPRTAEEWDRFFERCVQNRQAELLEVMRSIIAGVIPRTPVAAPTRRDELEAFKKNSIEHWDEAVGALPPQAPPRFPFGYYDVAFAIDGDFDQKSLRELKDIIQSSVRNYSGWPPFLTINRPPFSPKPVDRSVQCWMGPENDGSYSKPSHHDFWRVSPSGLFFTRRGYSEDGVAELPAGTGFDITTPTWRLGEAILDAAFIARAMGGESANLICDGYWAGLSGRRLVSRGNPGRMMFPDLISNQADYSTTSRIAISALPVALPEVIFEMLAPLYELFDFFKLPKRLVEEELRQLQKHQY